jgi:NAD(P)-dependent dehydrogenase (short-subunit alcohol dehydrogenase family)
VADRVALVTGANTGIGLGIAERFLAEGWAIGCATQGDDEKHRGPLDDLRGRHGDDRIHWVCGNLAEPEVPERLVAETADAFGRLDALVNNAGLSTAKPFLEITVDEFDRPSASTSAAASLRPRRLRGGCGSVAVARS